ncbi:hypothetical protein niasHT_009613 [Heterodera trifolii]|uniref:PWWP domain-containing protein n=1 Tax=Heterodera trifolii TaxID=157864 RepID=A0ABD2LVY2_9BILA
MSTQFKIGDVIWVKREPDLQWPALIKDVSELEVTFVQFPIVSGGLQQKAEIKTVTKFGEHSPPADASLELRASYNEAKAVADGRVTEQQILDVPAQMTKEVLAMLAQKQSLRSLSKEELIEKVIKLEARNDLLQRELDKANGRERLRAENDHLRNRVKELEAAAQQKGIGDQ